MTFDPSDCEDDWDDDFDDDGEEFPVEWNGKLWEAEDCDEMYLFFFDMCDGQVRDDMAVYSSDGLWIFPDGSTDDDREEDDDDFGDDE